VSEEAVQRLFGRITREQLTADDLAGGEGGVRQLQQQETDQVIALDLLEADDDAAADGNQRGNQRPGIEPPGQRIVEQRDVDRCEHGEQQDFGHRQDSKAAVEAKVSDAELQGPREPEATRRPGRPRQRVKGMNTRAAMATRTSTARSLSTWPARYWP